MNRRALLTLMLLGGGSLSQARAQKKKPEEPKLPPYFGPRKRLAVASVETKVKGITMVTALPSNPDMLITSVMEFSTPASQGIGGTGATTGLEFGQGLADMLITELIRSQRFIVLERESLSKLIEEQKTVVRPPVSTDPNQVNPVNQAQQAPPTDPNAQPPAVGAPVDPWDRETVVAGRLLGAQVMIFGAITELHLGKYTKKLGRGAEELNDKKSTDNSGYYNAPVVKGVGGVLGDLTSQRSEAVVVMDIKLVDVSTGQILDSVRAEGRVAADMKKLEIQNLVKFSFGSSSFTSSPLGTAVRSAIQDGVQKICARMEQVAWQAKVAAVDTDSGTPLLYLNAGGDAGLKEGDILDILRPGKEIKDPDTGLVIGRVPGKVLGKGKVTRVVDRKIAEVTPLAGTDYLPGDIVQLPPPPKASDK